MILKLKLWITVIEKERANQNGQSRDTDNIRHTRHRTKTKKYKQKTKKISKTEHQKPGSDWLGVISPPTGAIWFYEPCCTDTAIWWIKLDLRQARRRGGYKLVNMIAVVVCLSIITIYKCNVYGLLSFQNLFQCWKEFKEETKSLNEYSRQYIKEI